MSKKEKFFQFAGILVAIGLFWLMADTFGGWDIFAGVMAFMAASFVVMGMCMVAVIAIIYYLTVFRSNRYATRLRAAGYAVYLDKHQVWQFAIMVLVASVMTPMAVYMTRQFWAVHSCVQAGECMAIEGWYVIVPVVGLLIWLVVLLAIWATVSTWWQSFRPLRRYYSDMQRGHELDLPRLR